MLLGRQAAEQIEIVQGLLVRGDVAARSAAQPGAAPIRRVDGDPAIGEMHRSLGEPGSVAGDPVEKEQGRFSLAADGFQVR